MENGTRLLPEGVHAIHLPGKRFVRYDPAACDPKLLKKHLLYFSDKRLEGLAVSKAEIAAMAKLMRVSQRTFLNQYAATVALEDLEEALAAGGIDRLFETKMEPSSAAEVPGALTTREAVQAEIDALRSRFGIEQEVPARFVAKFSDIPGEEGTDAAFGFHGLPYLPAPYEMEIVFADEYLAYAKPYRDYLLLHEFAHCLQVLENWPYYGGLEEHHDESYQDACAKLGIDPEQEGGYYFEGSYRVTCQSCGDVKYVTEDEALRARDVTMVEFIEMARCPHCLGKVAAEPITAPVFVIGKDVFEVAPNGDCTVIGALKKPGKSQAQLHHEYGDIVYAVASYMDFRRYQASIERICYELEETWELYDFDDWLLGSEDGQLDKMLERLSDACDAVEETGDEAYIRMISALRQGQRIPAQDQTDLFGFKIGEVDLEALDKEECDLFAMEEGDYVVGANFELLCKFLKEYFEVDQDSETGVDTGIPFTQSDNVDDEKPEEASDEEEGSLLVKAELSNGDAWRRFVIPASSLFTQLHYSLAVVFDCADDVTKDFSFRVGSEEKLSQHDSFREKVVDKVTSGDAFSYTDCNGSNIKVTIEGLCHLDPSLPPLRPMIVGASEDADIFQLNRLSASLTIGPKEDRDLKDPKKLRAAYDDLLALFAAKCVDPSLVTPIN